MGNGTCLILYYWSFVSGLLSIVLRGGGVFTAAFLTTTQAKHVISERHTSKQVALL